MTSSPANPSLVVFEGVTPHPPRARRPFQPQLIRSCARFKVDWHGPYFASVSRDKCHTFLSQGDQGHAGGWVWVGVEDATALFEEYQRTGAKVRHPPTNYSWAYEMRVEDIDGNILRLDSEPRENEPFGEWLDRNGKVWPPA